MSCKEQQKKVLVAIVGAGPLGVELGLALKKAKIPFVQFEKQQIAQMIYNFPVNTHFFSSSERISLAGTPIQTVDQQKCSREEYLAYIRTLVAAHGLNVNTYEEVKEIEDLDSTGFRLTTQSNLGKMSYLAKYVVLATGGTAHPRSLGVPGEQLPHVSVKMNDPHVYFQKRVLVVGAKNSAAETALRCFHAGAKVSMVVRSLRFDSDRIKYWVLPELLGCIDKGQIDCLYGCRISAIEIGKVLLQNSSKETLTLFVDFVIKAIGFDADMSLFKQLSIVLFGEEQVPLYAESTMETSVKNAFVLGTAVGGTQKRYRVFIENCHNHISKIVATICDREGVAFPSELVKDVRKVEKNIDHLEE